MHSDEESTLASVSNWNSEKVNFEAMTVANVPDSSNVAICNNAKVYIYILRYHDFTTVIQYL